jgi:hypothetical protein
MTTLTIPDIVDPDLHCSYIQFLVEAVLYLTDRHYQPGLLTGTVTVLRYIMQNTVKGGDIAGNLSRRPPAKFHNTILTLQKNRKLDKSRSMVRQKMDSR